MFLWVQLGVFKPSVFFISMLLESAAVAAQEVIVVGGTGVFLMLLVTDGWVLHEGNSSPVE